MQPPDAGGPEAGPPYPVMLSELAQRRESSILALKQFVRGDSSTTVTETYLQPVTATIRNLPAKLSTPLYLPKVGSQAQMNEEETREALRRFINDSRNLIGANPAQLSLVERVDQPDGTKMARYEQRPFRYPLRGDYGKLEISFTGDRRLLNLSSTCIPDAERLQPSLAAITPRLTAEDAIKRVRNSTISFGNSPGTQQTYQLSASNELKATELVIYVFPSSTSPNSLEFHIAWEVVVSSAPFKSVYVDAYRESIIAAS